jgi:hypothetical protein
MSKEAIKRVSAIGAVLALAATPAAFAAKPDDPGSQGKGGGHSKKGGKAVVTYVFKGIYAGGGSVDVNHGNAHVKKADLVGTTVSFDLDNARILVADANADGSKNLDDVATDDRVVVKARLPRNDAGDQPYGAKQLVDQSHPPTTEGA